mgnify:CR=1 FL=1
MPSGDSKFLANDDEARLKRRESCFEIAKSHADNSVVYKAMHENAINVNKRTVKKVEILKTNSLF